MNAKRAKRLRRMARRVGQRLETRGVELPAVAYSDVRFRVRAGVLQHAPAALTTSQRSIYHSIKQMAR